MVLASALPPSFPRSPRNRSLNHAFVGQLKIERLANATWQHLKALFPSTLCATTAADTIASRQTCGDSAGQSPKDTEYEALTAGSDYKQRVGGPGASVLSQSTYEVCLSDPHKKNLPHSKLPIKPSLSFSRHVQSQPWRHKRVTSKSFSVRISRPLPSPANLSRLLCHEPDSPTSIPGLLRSPRCANPLAPGYQIISVA